MVRVKICGITSIEEMNLAASLGADAIGVLVGQTHRASDFVSAEAAAQICRRVPPLMTSVLVTHIEDPDSIIALARQVSATAIQLHSDLEANLIRKLRPSLFPVKIIRKVSIEGEAAIEEARRLKGAVDAIVLDSIDRSSDRVGGTGIVHDWGISARIVNESDIPVMLAGGLTPANVRDAILRVKPWAVDVNSGVENIDGRKSEVLMRDFINTAKNVG